MIRLFSFIILFSIGSLALADGEAIFNIVPEYNQVTVSKGSQADILYTVTSNIPKNASIQVQISSSSPAAQIIKGGHTTCGTKLSAKGTCTVEVQTVSGVQSNGFFGPLVVFISPNGPGSQSKEVLISAK